MMQNPQIETTVENYLNQICDRSIIIDAKNAQEQFKFNTVKRLFRAFDLFKEDSKYYGDFLLALRDYLLVYKTDISLDSIIIPDDNNYGILKDYTTGRYFASNVFPEYINTSFLEKVYQLQNLTKPWSVGNNSLYTDPLIYKLTGFQFFKSLAQKLSVYGALNTPDGYTTLVSLPTGGGKSLITQTMAYQKDGLTVVIVPTVSLAIDQERVAKQNIKTGDVDEEIFYYSSGVDAKPILESIKLKKARLLFISPESLMNNQVFNDVIKEANTSRYLKNIIIDEAHIVIDWGASFRIAYQCLESWRRKLMIVNPSIRTILLSATFEEKAISILKDFFSNDDRWIEIRCDSLRHEPHYMLIEARSYSDKQAKMLEMVRTLPHPMIIYVAKPDEASTAQKYLAEHGIHNVKTFTGLTRSEQRKELIDEWIDDQYSIMIATSAFGVGVDKADVRTVLHMYIPQNPNAYYQELGRGGRDKLSCLSVMCITQEDLNVSFQRISKKVMTTQKILGRWNSLYNNSNSQRMGDLSYIDTSIKPSYHEIDLLDDTPASDTEKNWNIYVLLLLRRYNLIKIHDVIVQSDKYVFVIEVIEHKLLDNDDSQKVLIEQIREDEWSYYFEAFKLMKRAISNCGKICWSEMFYETYHNVSEHCSGCNSHDEVVGDDFLDFPLKKSIKSPIKIIDDEQRQLLGGANNAIIYVAQIPVDEIINKLLEKRISGIVLANNSAISNQFEKLISARNLLLLGIEELKQLVNKRSYYYISGCVVVEYKGAPREIYSTLIYVLNNLANHEALKVIHLVDSNIYFDWIGKSFSDIVEGIVLSYPFN